MSPAGWVGNCHFVTTVAFSLLQCYRICGIQCNEVCAMTEEIRLPHGAHTQQLPIAAVDPSGTVHLREPII